VENLTIRSSHQKKLEESPLKITATRFNKHKTGNVHFSGVRIEDSVERPPLTAIVLPFEFHGFHRIFGDITVVWDGQEKREELPTDWAETHYPSIFEDTPEVVARDRLTIKKGPALAGAPSFPAYQQRGLGRYHILAEAGDNVEFALLFGQLGRYTGDKAKVEVASPSGKTSVVGDVEFQKTTAFRFVAEESGVYQVIVNAGTNWTRMEACSHPAFLATWPQELNFVVGGGECVFHVPSGCQEFALRFVGDLNEGMKLTLFAPDGRIVEEVDDTIAKQFTIKNVAAADTGYWRLRIAKPKNMVIEDHKVTIFGIPPILSLNGQMPLYTE
jgi:hypothetical protein